jgi:RHS repeat-associated protein
MAAAGHIPAPITATFAERQIVAATLGESTAEEQQAEPPPEPTEDDASDLPTIEEETAPAILETETVVAPVQARITPEEGGELRSADGRVHLIVPPGATEQPLRFEHRPVRSEPLPAQQAGRALEFELVAETDDARAEPVSQFRQELELRVDVSGLIDLSAMPQWQYAFLSYQDERGQWRELPTQRDGTWLVTRLEHFTLFGAGTGNVEQSGWLLAYNDAQVSTFSGALTYEYPIQAPAGRGGLTPDVRLSYNSHRVNGILTWVQSDWAGLGWTLDTMEIVRKVSPNWSGDWQGTPYWFSGGFHYENTFTLLYNGTGYKLIPTINETYGPPDGQPYGRYYTEDEQFLYVERRNAKGDGYGYSGSPVNTTSEYWIVRLRDGTEYRLGYNGDAEQTLRREYNPNNPEHPYAGDYTNWIAFRWRVDRVRDTLGTEISFSYHEPVLIEGCGDAREPASYLDQIHYNHAGEQTGTKITFVRAARDTDGIGDVITGGGHLYCRPWYQNDFLQKIRIENYAEGQYQILREYVLSYMQVTPPAQRHDNHTRLLQSITEYGRGGQGVGPALPPTTFDYYTDANKGSYDSCSPEECPWERSSFHYERLNKVDNGYGGLIQVDFTLPVGESWDSNQNPWNHIVGVKRVHDGQGGGHRLHYAWPSAANDRCYDGNNDSICDPAVDNGGALVGFRTCTVTLTTVDNTETVNKTYYEYALNRAESPRRDLGRELLQVREDAQGNPLEEIVTTWGVFTSTASSYFVYPSVIDEYIYVEDALPATPQRRTEYQYDTDYGNLELVKEYLGGALYRQTETSYNRNTSTSYWIIDRPAEIVVKDGAGAPQAKTRYYYDAAGLTTPPERGNVTQVDKAVSMSPTDTWLTVQTMAYDENAFYLPVAVTDANGNTTTTEYDATWQLYPISVTNALSQTTSYAYDQVSRQVTTVTGPNGADTAIHYAYDDHGRLTAVIRPGDSSSHPTVAYTYCDTCSPLRIITRERIQAGSDTSLRAIRFYNGLGQMIQENLRATEGYTITVSHYAYNAQGLLARSYLPYNIATDSGTVHNYVPLVDDPSRQRIERAYDALGRETAITNYDGATTRTLYEATANGWQITLVDANDHQRAQETDALGRLVRVQEFTGEYPNASLYATTVYTYSLLDLLTGVGDALGNVTGITYDALGRKVAMSDPDMGAWSYAYDPEGHLVRQTDARDKSVCFAYDALGRTTAKQYVDGDTCPAPLSQPDVLYSYDDTAAGNYGIGYRTGMSDASGSAHWRYDARGRTSAETRIIGGQSYTTRTIYRTDDLPISMVYPDGEIVFYAYDVWNRPISLSGDQSVEFTSYISEASYNALGQITQLGYGNDTAASYSYDPQHHRLSGIQVQGVLNLQYDYDDVGNVLTLTDGGQATTFVYDELDRLLSASGVYTASYSYDAIGNLLTKTEGPVTRNLTYPSPGQPRPHAPAQVDGQAYGYDANGNLTLRAVDGITQTLAYDTENRLTQVVSGTETITYTYSGDGDLVRKEATAGVTVYVGPHFELFVAADPPDPPDPPPAPPVSYTYALPLLAGGGGFALDGQPGVATKHYLLGGKRIAQREGRAGPVTYLYHDHLGSTAASSEQESIRYYPYGATRAGAVSTAYKYTGQRHETALGLYYYNARWYDPGIGRFIQADTIVPAPGNPQSLNRYAYVYNNPLRYTDPTGHNPALWLIQWGSSPVGQSVLHQLGQQASSLWAQAQGLVIQYGPQVLQWLQLYGDKLPMLLEASAKSGNVPPRSGDQSGRTANQGGFDPQNPWKAFRDAGMATEGIRQLEKGAARYGTDLNRAYQDFMFLKEKGIDIYGHALVRAQQRGISPSVMADIHRRAEGYGTRLYESGIEGHIAIWSSVKDIVIIVDQTTREIITTYVATTPLQGWTPLSPFDIPAWLLR